MSGYKSYRKEKWLYFVFCVLAYFLPFIIVTSIFFPMIEAAKGFKIAIGLGIVFINAIPFLMGIFRAFFAHFPMFNMLAVVFVALAAFFTFDVFQSYAYMFCWIEGAAALGSVVSCILWAQHRKYARWSESIKANVRSGAFVMKEGKE